MEYVSLGDLLDCLTLGTKLNICIDFFGRKVNKKISLQRKYLNHGKEYCEYMKSSEDGFSGCFGYRSLALGKVFETLMPFGGFCPNGVYEYVHPVIEKESLVAVIMVGNIYKKSALNAPHLQSFRDTFERDISQEDIVKICNVLDSHIRLLLRKYKDEPSDNPLVGRICNYIEEFLYNDISVSDIAEIFGYSEKYLGRLFKNETGVSIREYLLDKRLSRGAMLLENGSHSVAEISAESGFNNVTYFNRCFKKKYGMTPLEFRNRFK